MIGQYYVNNDRYAERLLQASYEVWCPPQKIMTALRRARRVIDLV